jgi:hypothetical protein
LFSPYKKGNLIVGIFWAPSHGFFLSRTEQMLLFFVKNGHVWDFNTFAPEDMHLYKKG